jgi:hypothetical protein
MELFQRGAAREVNEHSRIHEHSFLIVYYAFFLACKHRRFVVSETLVITCRMGISPSRPSIFRTGVVRTVAEKGVLMRTETKAPVLRPFCVNVPFQFTPFVYVF